MAMLSAMHVPSSSSSTGTFFNGFLATNSGLRFSPFCRSICMISTLSSKPFSARNMRTRRGLGAVRVSYSFMQFFSLVVLVSEDRGVTHFPQKYGDAHQCNHQHQPHSNCCTGKKKTSLFGHVVHNGNANIKQINGVGRSQCSQQHVQPQVWIKTGESYQKHRSTHITGNIDAVGNIIVACIIGFGHPVNRKTEEGNASENNQRKQPHNLGC